MKPRFSMTVRMAVTNTVISAVVVGVFGYFNAVGTQEAFRQSAQREEADRRTELRRRGESEGRRIAANSLFAIANNDFGFLTSALGPVVEADPGLSYAFILGRDGQLVAKSERLRDGLSRKRIEAAARDPSRPVEIVEAPYGRSRVLEVGVPIASEQRAWGRVVLGYSQKYMLASLADLDRTREAEVVRIWKITLFLAVVLLFISTLAAVVQGIRVGRPIVALTRAAERIAEGELGTRVDLRGGAELGVLADRFDHMSRELADLVAKVATQAAMEQEMEVARSVQDALIPAPVLHEVGELLVCGLYEPASRCGGDWWFFSRLTRHRTLFVVGDVTGHGVPATLITATARACCEAVCTSNAEFEAALAVTPEAETSAAYLARRKTLTYLLGRLNSTVVRAGRGRFCMTCFTAVLDTDKRTLTYANAGHVPPLIFVPIGEGQADDRQSVDALHAGATMCLGERIDPVFSETTVELSPGSTIVLYTDGLVEATNATSSPFGERRLMRSLKKRLALPPDRLGAAVVNDVAVFGEGAAAEDDVTIVTVRWPARTTHQEIDCDQWKYEEEQAV